MSRSYFDTIAPIAYRGPSSTHPLSFRWYDKDRRVLGKRMEDHLRFAVCYWHNFVWTGLDPFGGATFQRPWFEGGTPWNRRRARPRRPSPSSRSWACPTTASTTATSPPRAPRRARGTRTSAA